MSRKLTNGMDKIIMNKIHKKLGDGQTYSPKEYTFKTKDIKSVDDFIFYQVSGFDESDEKDKTYRCEIDLPNGNSLSIVKGYGAMGKFRQAKEGEIWECWHSFNKECGPESFNMEEIWRLYRYNYHWKEVDNKCHVCKTTTVDLVEYSTELLEGYNADWEKY